MNLKPCPYRQVDDEGHILCDKIKTGEREVTPNICRACPVAAINCAHLRGTLDHQARPPITVRWGNGKSTVLEDAAPTIALGRAACAAKVIPIHSPRDCAGCALRQPLPEVIAPTRTTNERRTRATAPVAPSPIAPAAPPPVAPTEIARQNVVAQKIIQLQEWLAHQKQNPPRPDEEKQVAPIVLAAPRARVKEERRAGWTD
ncbi:MAG: hypothetical protein HY868_22555 [Chloroflexi bacterium]|nr:hypothetical protein [Chloroflexota bacterium]